MRAVTKEFCNKNFAEGLSVISILPKRSPGHQITIDGFRVLRVEVEEDQSTGKWNLTYDRRFGVVAENIEELQRWLWIVANAQAVGEGYSCHGENSAWRPNPHKVQVMCIGSIETGPVTDTPGG